MATFFKCRTPLSKDYYKKNFRKFNSHWQDATNTNQFLLIGFCSNTKKMHVYRFNYQIILFLALFFVLQKLVAEQDFDFTPNFWTESSKKGFNWYGNSYFGYFKAFDPPQSGNQSDWVLHGQLGWLYIEQPTGQIFLIYSLDHGWIASSGAWEDFLFFYEHGWSYWLKTSFDPTWVYWVSEQVWQPLQSPTAAGHPFDYDFPASIISEGIPDMEGFPSGTYTAQLSLKVDQNGSVFGVEFLFGTIDTAVDDVYFALWEKAAIDACYDYLFNPAMKNNMAKASIYSPVFLITHVQ